MITILIKILFFSCIPLGIILLVFAIKKLRKKFNQHSVLEFPYQYTSHLFHIKEAGIYAIWLKGPLLKKTPVTKFEPRIVNADTKINVTLNKPFFRTQLNGYKQGQIKLFYFTVKEGDYEIRILEGSSSSKIEGLISQVLPNSAPEDSFFIQLKKSRPFYITILLILLIIISAGLIFGGLVLGLLSTLLFGLQQ